MPANKKIHINYKCKTLKCLTIATIYSMPNADAILAMSVKERTFSEVSCQISYCFE